MSGIIPRETVSCLNSPFLPHQELVTVIRLWKSSLLYPPDVPWNVVIVIGAVQGRNPAKIDAWFKHLIDICKQKLLRNNGGETASCLLKPNVNLLDLE